jgi:NAD(P)-dependent dehydrogenase (short-subunit alcohol dehydrogenase family)
MSVTEATGPDGATEGRPEAADTSVSAVLRHRWRPVETAPAVPSLSLKGRSVAVLGGTAEQRDGVVAALATAGASPRLAPTTGDVAGWSGPEDSRLAEAMAAFVAAGPVDGIVDLGVAGAFSAAEPDLWVAPFCATVALVQATYDDWVAEDDARRLFYLAVTRMGGRLGYDGQGVEQPLGGIWSGFAKGLPQELPNCRVKVLDVAPPDLGRLGELVVTEACTPELYEVGYRNGRRAALAAATEPVGPPAVTLRPGDVVLFTGGARGIGAAVARRLAERHRCRVVVTGRSPLPDASEPWLGMDEEAFRRDATDRLRHRPDGRSVAEVRRENERRADLREVVANLAAARADGLDLEYRVCDATDAEAVAALVRPLAARLKFVVHNAGIASPTRLRNKSLVTVTGVVRAKVAGFANLVAALEGPAGGVGHGVELLCNVGSVSGRVGGTLGQVDYAAANEALTRLGFWATAGGLPVTTMCWTTWARVGLIGNYDAAIRWGTAVSLQEGVTRWEAEMLAARPGEVMFLGRIGRALSPRQPGGFAKFRDHPDVVWMASARHHLGEIVRFVPFRSATSVNRFRRGDHPCLGELTVGGAPTLPVGVVLEHAAAVADWVAMEGWPELHLRELRDVHLDLDALRFDEGELALTKSGTGRSLDGQWVVDVELATSRPVGGLRLVLAAERTGWEGPAATAPAGPPSPPVMPEGAVAGLRWRGAVHRLGGWEARGHLLGARVPLARPSDAWMHTSPPRAPLPVTAVEAIVQGAATTVPAGGRARWVRLGSVRLAGEGPGSALNADATVVDVVGSPPAGAWRVTTTGGRPLLACEGVEVLAS